MAFALLLQRPLSLLPLWLEMQQKTARLAELHTPKLVILAGSNGPYSHSCVVMGHMLDLPCENAGIAVGIGLDEIFARYSPRLKPGDIVYMPMEFQQYATTAVQYRALVDGALLLRHDRPMLWHLSSGRMLGSIFCCTLDDALEALIEMPLAAFHLHPAAEVLAREYNLQGDRIDNVLKNADQSLLLGPPPIAPDAQAINQGYGTQLIAHFVQQERARGVTIIGGWPVGFADMQVSPATRRAIQRLYGTDFLNLPNKGQYPRQDFFNAPEHLVRSCQFLNSIMVARGLAVMLHRLIIPPDAATVKLSVSCPMP